MKYKVCNLVCDMKLMRDSLVIIKRGQSVLVSQQEYQYLAQVYGMAVKGEKEYTVRATAPVKIDIATEQTVAESEPVAHVKKRKSKKS